jgi:hypothetical protein
MFRIH